LEKIRENKKPKDLEELKLAIKKDVQYVRENDFVVLTFGTFDVTHPGHKFYLKESSYL
jgi:FAD synthase